VRGTVSDRSEAVEARQAVLKAELARIRSLLAGRPEVVALWAFGSVASDRVDEWSDLDLVVVVRSEEGFLDRSVRLGRWLEPRVGADLLVYTPEEVRGLLEKALKALLAASGELVPRTHRLADLWQRLPATDRNALVHLRHAAFDLDRYYLPARYPDALPGVLPEGLPGKEHAERAVETCRRVLGYVRQQLGGAQ
jgi:HEPN domain-containing protein